VARLPIAPYQTQGLVPQKIQLTLYDNGRLISANGNGELSNDKAMTGSSAPRPHRTGLPFSKAVRRIRVIYIAV